MAPARVRGQPRALRGTLTLTCGEFVTDPPRGAQSGAAGDIRNVPSLTPPWERNVPLPKSRTAPGGRCILARWPRPRGAGHRRALGCAAARALRRAGVAAASPRGQAIALPARPESVPHIRPHTPQYISTHRVPIGTNWYQWSYTRAGGKDGDSTDARGATQRGRDGPPQPPPPSSP